MDDIKNLGESLQQSKSLYAQLDYIEDELFKFMGRMVEFDNRLGAITNFDCVNGKLVVEFGFKGSSDLGIKFYDYEDLINGKLKLY